MLCPFEVVAHAILLLDISLLLYMVFVVCSMTFVYQFLFTQFTLILFRFFAVTHIELSKPGNVVHQLGRMLAVDPR